LVTQFDIDIAVALDNCEAAPSLDCWHSVIGGGIRNSSGSSTTPSLGRAVSPTTESPLDRIRRLWGGWEGQRVLTPSIRLQSADWLIIEVEDSGVGIDANALSRLFEFGFTTKTDGHGFGLHSSAILAKELGGDVSGHSEGPGRGARFTLRLPLTSASQMVDRKRA